MKKENVNLDNEYLVLSYFLRNIKELTVQKINLFQNHISKVIAESAYEIKVEDLKFSLETIYNKAQKKKDFSFEILDNIYENFTDFKNIEYHIKELESDYAKNVISKGILTDLIAKSQGSDRILVDEVLQQIDRLKKTLVSTLDTAVLKDTFQLAGEYRDIIRERKEGLKKNRSIGFRVLDSKLTKPAAPKELTIIAALRGSGKTIFKQTIHNNIVLKNIPVVEFSLEMSDESNMDRTIAMKASMNTFDLNKNITNETMKKVENVLRDFEKYKNFLSTDESDMSIDMIDSMLYKAKEIFHNRGLLPEDEYLFYSVDLLDMLNDFGESKPVDIKRSMDKWFKVNKKHNTHGVGLVQINENKLRSMRFTEVEDIDQYRANIEDIYGGSAYAQRARTVMLLHRPRFMKERYFPDREDEWFFEPDIIQCHIVKQNEGSLFMQKFVFSPEIMKIVPYYSSEDELIE